MSDVNIALYFGTSKFDSCWKDENGEVVQGVHDIPSAKDDCHTLRVPLERYQICDNGDNGIYNLDDDPSWTQLVTAKSDIQNRLKNNPDVNFLVIYVVASHGIHRDGK